MRVRNGRWVLGALLLVVSLSACSAITTSPDAGLQIDQSARGKKRFNLSGPLDEVTSNVLIIDGQHIVIDDNTIISSDLVPGQTLHIEAVVQPDGSLLAVEVEAANVEAESAHFEWSGVVQSITDAGIVVGGVTFDFPSGFTLDPAITVGTTIHIEGVADANGNLVVGEIDLEAPAQETPTLDTTATVTVTVDPTEQSEEDDHDGGDDDEEDDEDDDDDDDGKDDDGDDDDDDDDDD
jgi:hypothetical protein